MGQDQRIVTPPPAAAGVDSSSPPCIALVDGGVGDVRWSAGSTLPPLSARVVSYLCRTGRARIVTQPPARRGRRAVEA